MPADEMDVGRYPDKEFFSGGLRNPILPNWSRIYFYIVDSIIGTREDINIS